MGDSLFCGFAGIEAFSIRTAEDDLYDFEPRLRTMLEHRCMDWADLPRENDHGCIEYKSYLGSEHAAARTERLATQMNFRLREGGGTAFYLLGVADSGSAVGLRPKEHAEAVRVLMDAAAVSGSVVLLEALSERRKAAKRCSVWRVQAKDRAVEQVADTLCSAEA